MNRIASRIVAAFLCTLALVACKSDDDDDDAPPEGQGSPVCNEWQGALCNRVARCGATPELVETCRRQASMVTCSSDERAASCVSSLTTTDCSASPGECDLADLADHAPAYLACQRFSDALCASYERCTGGTKAECLALPATVALCDRVIGYSLTFDDCERDLGTHACEAEDVPASCNDVILRQR